jgi:hypothetical protein
MVAPKAPAMILAVSGAVPAREGAEVSHPFRELSSVPTSVSTAAGRATTPELTSVPLTAPRFAR